jgi:hypothetical protein
VLYRGSIKFGRNSFRFFATHSHVFMDRVAQSVQQMTRGWAVHGSNPGGREIFRTRPDQPWVPPRLLYNGYRVFPRGKAAGAWCWHLPPSSSEVENEQSYTSTPPLGPWWPVIGRTLPLPLPFSCVHFLQLRIHSCQANRIPSIIIVSTNPRVFD